MSEKDASLQRALAWDTDLDLLKEETVLELELDMEERLTAFRERKMDEVATHRAPTRQARGDHAQQGPHRRDEGKHASAEIEAQLGFKRAGSRPHLWLVQEDGRVQDHGRGTDA